MGLDAARAGITVYGLYPSDEVERNMKIYPAMEIRSFITYVKEVEPGTPISYGGTFCDGTVRCGSRRLAPDTAMAIREISLERVMS